MTDPLLAVSRLAKDSFTELCAAIPAQEQAGGTLLLGRNYAASERGILMLGLNPGGKFHDKLYLERYAENCLLPGSPDHGFRYWHNARTLFGATEALHDEMQSATFSFCCPFRTSTWSGLSREHRDTLMRVSRPVLARIMEDCRPRLVIVAGVASLEALRTIGAPRCEIGACRDSGGDSGGTYQWRSYNASFDGTPFVVAQVPHMSRANSSAKLLECGRWLTEILNGAS